MFSKSRLSFLLNLNQSKKLKNLKKLYFLFSFFKKLYLDVFKKLKKKVLNFFL